MEEIGKNFNAKDSEDRIYNLWETSGSFRPNENGEPYSIVMPPPNATGTLHLGHATMLALQDILIRTKRMQGYSVLWLPGTDHAAIATQSVVEKKLISEGIKNPRETLGRDGLLKEIRNFVEHSKKIINNQVRKMGASCDWTRERYTFSSEMNKAVNTLFKFMYEDGLIYRGGRLVNWDPKMQTTVSDDELEYIEEKTTFYTFQYGPFQIGTSRPETKFGDKYIVMNPKDKRYEKFKNNQVIKDIEWIDGKITATIIKHESVDMGFGTGVMTITPWHDSVDFDIAESLNLEKEQIIDLNGRIKVQSKEFNGLTIEEAREKVVETLRRKNLIVKEDKDYIHNIAINSRGKGKIEPQIMEQWFVNVNKKAIDWKGKLLSIKEILQDTVKSGMIKIIPARFEKIYFNWIDNLRDWCISRQIWWGHRVPVWTHVNCNSNLKSTSGANGAIIFIEPPDPSSKIKCPACNEGIEFKNFTQDPDTLDTWFSSGLWTFSTLGWPEKTPDLIKFSPSSVLETGYDIIFFWVARMILASTYALRKTGFSEEKSVPFKDVYLHGLIRDIHGKKMSKSNPETCIDPLDMIELYGTDAVRLSLVMGSSPGNDLRLYEEKIKEKRNFINKVWNSTRFLIMQMEKIDETSKSSGYSRADKWILTRIEEVVDETTKSLNKYGFSEAGFSIYNFFWDEFCNWYLEISKINPNTKVLKYVLESSLKLMHPFMPFVTEELWGHLQKENSSNLLINESWPINKTENLYIKETEEMIRILELISSIRTLRGEAKVDPVKKIDLIIKTSKNILLFSEESEIIKKLSRLENLKITDESEILKNAFTSVGENYSLHIPLESIGDPSKVRERILKDYENAKFLLYKQKIKCENKEFMKNAPKDLVSEEIQKLELANEKISKMEVLIAGLE